ncbi:hypothetical protein PM082_022695 [Marasmius tenuissimus]|nr:hypothetical protein PM082_022695 [Marasmius tenuissimus]
MGIATTFSAPSPTPTPLHRTFNDKANLSDNDDKAIEAGIFATDRSITPAQLAMRTIMRKK